MGGGRTGTITYTAIGILAARHVGTLAQIRTLGTCQFCARAYIELWRTVVYLVLGAKLEMSGVSCVAGDR